MSADQRNEQVIKALGADLFAKVKASKILVVGAGGIGSELLKNLVLSGFSDIEIIDLDTIDVSNLNRQFLFRKEHVGHSKARVARESALVFNPHVNIVAHHGNIKSHEFGPDFFKKFTLVMNALDNLDARRHVNRICLATEIPLIESGTAGYLGQVTVIKKDETECFECQPKEAPKTYPVCTIRSNPTAPIHCIVWAKYLYERLFGKQEDTNAVTDLQDDKVNEEGTVSDPLAPEQKAKGFSNWVFHKVYHTDIIKLASMADLWKEKTPPKPLYLPTVLGTLADAPHKKLNFTGMKDQQVWTLLENAEKLIVSVDALQKRKEKEGEQSWDKDDAVALDFVTSASNLRAHIFGIPLLSRFDVKEKAGNIIPAIATTNAIIAGLIVIEAFKIIKGELNKCKSTYLLKQPSRKRLLLPTALEQKNPSCYVCARSFLKLRINTKLTTLGGLVQKVICGALGLIEPTIMVGANIIYECGEDTDATFVAKQSAKFLADTQVTHNADLTIEDFMQEMNVLVSILHDDILEANDFEVLGNVSTSNNRISGETNNNNNNNNNNNQNNIVDDDVQEIVPSQKDIASANEPKKRKRTDVL